MYSFFAFMWAIAATIDQYKKSKDSYLKIIATFIINFVLFPIMFIRYLFTKF